MTTETALIVLLVVVLSALAVVTFLLAHREE
jgi:hypothetical protein